jgi:hypothetical protein
MVSYCVNPSCRAESKVFDMGDLYALERRSADTEFFWLCSDCVPVVALCLDPLGSVLVRPQSDTVRPQPPHPDGYLRLVTHRKLGAPWRRGSLASGLTVSSGYVGDPFSSSSDAE